MGLSSTKYDSIVDTGEVLKAFAHVICMKKYSKEPKVSAVRGVSNMSTRKNNKEVLPILLKLPGSKFLDSFSELLMENNVRIVIKNRKRCIRQLYLFVS